MEKINELLVKLDNKVSAKIARKIGGLKQLNERLALAQQEHDNEPTEESEETLNDIKNYVDETTEDLIEEMEDYLEARKAQPINPPTPPFAPVVPKEDEKEEKKKSGLGFFGVVAGAVVLIATAGALNLFSKRN